MVKATSPDPYKIESKGIKSVRERVTNIQDYLTEALSPESFKELMVQAILGEGSFYQLSEAEAARARALGREKFQDRSAIYGLNPPFTAEKSRRLPGGRLTIRYRVKQGLIQDIHFSGDFFATDRLLDLEAVFVGQALNREDLRAALDRAAATDRVNPPEVNEIVEPAGLKVNAETDDLGNAVLDSLKREAETVEPQKRMWDQVIRGISTEDILDTLLA